MTPLMAKSGDFDDYSRTLVGHTSLVLSAVSSLFGEPGKPTRLAESWLRFFQLSISDFDRFLHHLRVAAAFHDWGKANDGFVNAVTEGGEQVVRHEHISALLLTELIIDKSFADWFRNSGLDTLVLRAAVVSHHVKSAANGEHAVGAFVGKRDSFKLLSDHEDFETIWRLIQEEVGSPCPSVLPFPARFRKEMILDKSRSLIADLDREKSRLREDRVRWRWIASVRAALIAADSVGSAVVRMDDRLIAGEEAAIGRWVRDCFDPRLTGEAVWKEVIKRRIADLRARKRWDDSRGSSFGDERGFNEFQCLAASQGPRVLLTAPCGSGKTLAAWNWIKTQLDREPRARVLFLYPTRATATEGFRDYVSWAPEDDAGLLSGTADYELRDMFETPENMSGRDDPRRNLDYRSDPRLYALGHWKKRIFSATADQFFPFMQYAYGPLCLLPLLVESVLVVDEVHSFDKSMFATLRRFLVEFPSVPVLCMTATLSIERRRDLVEECGLMPYPETPPQDLIDDSSYPRYHVEWIDREGANDLCRGALENGKRVLWVSNRVKDCQDVYKEFPDGGYIGPGQIKTFCYHSRFKLDDRKARHKELIRAFQDAVNDEFTHQAILGATTQVCEMSLDLDAEILITELAPIASLIQRMGRCNRDSKRMKSRPIGRVYVLRSEFGKEKPYEKDELEAARRFVDGIAGRDISQDGLESVYRECDPLQVEPQKLCPFLDSGPYAEAREMPFRDIDEFTVPCVLDKDLTAVLALLHERDPDLRKPIDGYIVPVPRRFANVKKPEDSRFPKWLSVASMIAYDSSNGFDERELLSKENQDT